MGDWDEVDRIVPIPDREPAPQEESICPVSGTTTCTASPKQQRKCSAC